MDSVKSQLFLYCMKSRDCVQTMNTNLVTELSQKSQTYVPFRHAVLLCVYMHPYNYPHTKYNDETNTL